jgi:hypothetical protein
MYLQAYMALHQKTETTILTNVQNETGYLYAIGSSQNSLGTRYSYKKQKQENKTMQSVYLMTFRTARK